jgi:electron transfer flavoprotein beta subunit
MEPDSNGVPLKIAVCLKQVPSTDTRVKVAADGKWLDPAGVTLVINPYDEYALEEALRLKEAQGGEVVAYSAGGPGVISALRNALAIGADAAVLLKTEAELDSLGAARLLAAELAGKGYDLVLFGKQAVDDDAAQVPAMTAELLQLPCATVVVKLEVAGGRAKAVREIEGGVETLDLALPAVVAAQKGLNEPRYASLKGIMAAKKKPIEEKAVTPPAPVVETVSLTLPPARPAGRIVGEGVDAVAELVRALREEAKVL